MAPHNLTYTPNMRCVHEWAAAGVSYQTFALHRYRNRLQNSHIYLLTGVLDHDILHYIDEDIFARYQSSQGSCQDHTATCTMDSELDREIVSDESADDELMSSYSEDTQNLSGDSISGLSDGDEMESVSDEGVVALKSHEKRENKDEDVDVDGNWMGDVMDLDFEEELLDEVPKELMMDQDMEDEAVIEANVDEEMVDAGAEDDDYEDDEGDDIESPSLPVAKTISSDADTTFRSPLETAQSAKEDAKYIAKPRALWIEEGGDEYQEIAFPAGYVHKGIPRTNENRINWRLWGHPNHREFTSYKNFYPHFVYLVRLSKGAVQRGSCGCRCCTMKSRKPA